MKKEELLKRQNEIDKEIKKVWGLEGSLDGITDIDEWIKIEENNELKTLWILKETNRDSLPKENFNQRDFNKNEAGWSTATYTNIMKVTMGIREYAVSGGVQQFEKKLPKLLTENGNRDFKYYISPSDEEWIEPLKQIAIINVHKGIGSKKSNDTFIAAQYDKPEVRKIILDQVEYINPDIIIVCNKVDRLLCDLAGVDSISKYTKYSCDTKYFEKNVSKKQLIISTGHPLGKTAQTYCDAIFEIIYGF